ncbi:MAG: FAD-dependent monooxygenase [Pseudomonadales bacterium]|nr:FAD-dependent monooxygenase [Pseudomonadales bacterium]
MNIAILGGGIAGLSAAITLKQAGFDVEIYERHPGPSEIGAGIVCWPNAAFVLDQLGVLDEVAQVSGVVSSMNRFSSDGELLGSLDIHTLSSVMGYPSYSIIRKDLMNILSRRVLELGIKLHYQHKVSGLSDNASGQVEVTFENTACIQPDIIIGADGRMNSIARKYVIEDNQPVYQGFINWIGVFESADALFTDSTVSDYWGTGERFGIVPVSSTKAYWAGGVVCEKIGLRDPLMYKQELNALFRHWPSPIDKIINDTAESRINKIYVHDHNPIKTWHRNNVVLLGDAAHSPLPTSGQGACQALEDAWHIANCLKVQSHNLDQAFTQFTQLRVDKTTGITLGGRQLAASIFNQDAEFCRQRNLAAKNTDYKKSVLGMAKGWASGLPMSA